MIMVWHRSNETSKRLHYIPGVGPMLATALVASVADPRTFRSGRNFSARIGRRDCVAHRLKGQLDAPVGKKGRGCATRVTGRARTMLAKASSISRLEPGFSDWICIPIARPAASTSRKVDLFVVIVAGSTSTTTRATPGTSSRRSSSRFAATSAGNQLTPVKLAPGRARRLATHQSHSHLDWYQYISH